MLNWGTEEIVDAIIKALPHEPSTPYWAINEEILSKDEAAINAIADLIEQIGGEYITTGYYDPETDKRNNEVDKFTGYYYLNV